MVTGNCLGLLTLKALPCWAVCHSLSGKYGGHFNIFFQAKIKKKIGYREDFRQIQVQVFCFRFDNCNNTILVYAYILIYYHLTVVSGCDESPCSKLHGIKVLSIRKSICSSPCSKLQGIVNLKLLCKIWR